MLGDDLRKHCLRALAHGSGPGRDLDQSRRTNPNADLLVGAAARPFDKIRNAQPNEAALRARLPLPRPEAVIIDALQRIRLAGGIVAQIEHDRNAAAGHETFGVRHPLFRNEIAAANFGAINVQFAGGEIEHALHHEHALRLTGAPHRRNRNFVRQRDLHVHAEGRQMIGERHRGNGALRHGQSAGSVGAVIVQQLAAQTTQSAIGLKGDFHVPELIALLCRRDEVFAPVFEPAHRTAERKGRGSDCSFLLVEHELGPETTAHIGRDHPNGQLLAPKNFGEQPGGDQRRLRRCPDRQLIIGRFERSETPSPLHEHRATAMRAEALAHDVRCAKKGRVQIAIAAAELSNEIVCSIIVHDRRVWLERIPAIDGGGKRLEFDVDQTGGVFGDVSALGYDHRQRLADIDRFSAGEYRAVAALAVCLSGNATASRLVATCRRSPGAVNTACTPGRVRAASVSTDRMFRMRVRAAQECGVQHPVEPDIRDEAASARQQSGGLLAGAWIGRRFFRSHALPAPRISAAPL